MEQKCNCGKIIPKSSYAIAQKAMGHSVFYTCPDCKTKNKIVD